MIRRSRRSLAILAPFFLLAACNAPPEPAQREVARPVKTLLIGATESSGQRRFPARVAAGRTAELAFRVPGTLQELSVKEGEQVSAGQRIAGLDASDFQLKLEERQTTFENARKNYERGRELVGNGAISKVDFDRLEAEFKNAQTALDAARQELSYTELKAPFAGVVARRYVDNYEEVQAKQPVLALQDLSALEVKFDVPERVIRSLRSSQDGDGQARELVQVEAAFEGHPQKSYRLTFREVATRADPQTQTFEVTYGMPKPEDITVLPGMTANVMVQLPSGVVTDEGQNGAVSVPVAALAGDPALQPRVWVVDEASMTVSSRPVQVGELSGREIEVLSGLHAGDRIAVAGAAYLAEGMPVTLMPETEQAEPRADE